MCPYLLLIHAVYFQNNNNNMVFITYSCTTKIRVIDSLWSQTNLSIIIRTLWFYDVMEFSFVLLWGRYSCFMFYFIINEWISSLLCSTLPHLTNIWWDVGSYKSSLLLLVLEERCVAKNKTYWFPYKYAYM